MNRRFRKLVAVALIGSAAFLGGCYTLLRHPVTEDGYEHGDFSQCRACHDTYSHFTPYDPLYADRWWEYYAVPWWYGEVIVIEEDGERPVDRAIRGREPHLRDGSGGGGPVMIKRRPFSEPPDTTASGGGPAKSAAEERQSDEPVKKESPSKRATKRGESDGEDTIRIRSRNEDSNPRDENGDGGTEGRSKKRKES